MKRKNIISLTVAFAFLALGTTGILLFVKQKEHFVEITHTVFGLLFVGFAIFHILNNWGSIKSYSTERTTGKFQKELLVSAGIFGVVLIGGVTEFLEPVAEAGRIFASKRPERAQMLSFEEIKTNQKTQGLDVEVLIEKQKDINLPAVAMWVESDTGRFLELIFAPAVIEELSAGTEDIREALREGKVKQTTFAVTQFTGLKDFVLKPNYEKGTPNENLKLLSKIYVKAPYVLKLQAICNGKTEVFQGQVLPETNIVKLKCTDNKILKSVIVSF
jgi:Domain of unknown function (DUF4405)